MNDMEILLWTTLTIVNAFYAESNHRKGDYRGAMFCAFAAGWSVVFLMYAITEIPKP